MTMIYDPAIDDFAEQFAVKFSDAIDTAAMNAIMYFAANWAMSENMPWTYYAGVASASLAASTGIPGAAAAFYVVGDILDFYVFKQPKGSLLRVYLNGVAAYSVATYTAAGTWELIQMALNDTMTKVEIVSEPDPAHPDGMAQSYAMTIGFPFAVTSTRPETAPARIMGAGLRSSDSVWQIVYTLMDASGKKARTKLYYPGAATFEETSTYALAVRDAYLGGLGLVTGAIVDIAISQETRLPGGLKAAPRSQADVEEQMRFSLATEDNKRTVHSVPTWDKAYTQLNTAKQLRRAAVSPVVDEYTRLIAGSDVFDPVTNQRGEPLTRIMKSRGKFKS